MILECLRCVLLDMCPLLSVDDLIIECRIIKLNFHCFLGLFSFDLLAALVLIDDTLRHAGVEPVLALGLVFNQLLKLLIELIFLLNLSDFGKVP